MAMPVRREDQTFSASRPLVAAWRLLYPDPDTSRPGDAGARAALRRAGSPDAVMLEPAFHMLLLRMKTEGFDFSGFADWRYRRLALIAGLLAERRDGNSGPRRFMQALGGAPKAEERAFSTLRFQALMAALDRGLDADAMTSLRRAMKVAAQLEFNAGAFADDLMNWGDATRIKWTFDYFGRPHLAAAPQPVATETEETSR
ncbi:type I-E CRISPR-associated protein Cse2/CasB [Aquibium microcysteis]|uniref:type I-E CRISPR-associated protein Cse2/CasB n=1 Tax=Aquibium microcysteis TaxID=675281 RepID=UPI00165D2A31|nr:type I-E CRISPR-associated protein Cse2/CasB [Aquibium microcysteis]